MRSGWQIRALGDIVISHDARRVPVKEADRRAGSYPYYGASGIVDYVNDYIFEGLHLLVAEDGENLRTRKTPIAFLANGRFWVNNHAHILTGNHLSNTRFLSYALSIADVASYLSGSTMPKLTQGNLLRIPILLPRISEQEHIVDILSALDDKIELNRRMNEKLEASARALFRDWFVDFGPTRAKVEGRPAYLASDLWSLFPNQFAGNGVPEGWSETPLDQIAEFLNGLALQKFPAAPNEESLPVIKIGELRSGVSASSNRASTDVPARYIIGDGDFLFSWSGSLLAKFWTEGAGALNQHLFKVTSDSFPPWFFSQWVWQHLAEFQMIAASKATTMGHIQRGHLSAATTITPPPAMLAKMSEVMQPLLDQIIGNLLECRTLVATRDALLPKLMSGALRVRDAEALAA